MRLSLQQPPKSSCKQRNHAGRRPLTFRNIFTNSAEPRAAASSSCAANNVIELDCGRLTISVLSKEDVIPACIVLTRAFIGTPEQIVLEDAQRYAKAFVGMTFHGTFLVGKLQPSDPALLPPKQTSRLVATVAVSFHPDTRQTFPTLEPPGNAAYLSNMAVDQKLRRCGIARAMMAAAESSASAAGHREIYLHVRQQDPVAQQLYKQLGYGEIARDGMMATLQGVPSPRILLRKALTW